MLEVKNFLSQGNDMGYWEEWKIEPVSKIMPIIIRTSHGMHVAFFMVSVREKGNNFVCA
jgi:hypothetical protein